MNLKYSKIYKQEKYIFLKPCWHIYILSDILYISTTLY